MNNFAWKGTARSLKAILNEPEVKSDNWMWIAGVSAVVIGVSLLLVDHFIVANLI